MQLTYNSSTTVSHPPREIPETDAGAGCAALVSAGQGSSFGINLAVGCLGKLWFVGVVLLCTPYYLRVLGPEGYGLIAFYIMLQRLASLLDSGLSTTINREQASHHGRGADNGRARDMLRTLEVVYWGISILVLATIVSVSGWIATSWIESDKLLSGELKSLVVLMGIAIAVQLPQSFYSAALEGQQRHVAVNLVRASWQGTRFIGAVAVLAFIATTPQAFFHWQIATGILVTLVTALVVRRSLLHSRGRARFRVDLLKDTFVFTTGAGAITLTAAIVSQLDKVILSKQLSNEQFGYYMLAYAMPSALFLVCGPIQAVVFPRLSQHVAQNSEAGIRRSYFLGSQLTLFAVAPAAITGMFFSRELLTEWLNNPEVADSCYQLTALLFCGIGINCLSSIPHSLQLAHGWTRLANVLNLASIVALVPGLLWTTSRYGLFGAGIAWGVYGLVYLMLQVHYMHRRLLRDAKWNWIVGQLWPLLLCVGIGFASRYLFQPERRLEVIATVLVTWIGCCATVVATSPMLRDKALAFCSGLKNRFLRAEGGA